MRLALFSVVLLPLMVGGAEQVERGNRIRSSAHSVLFNLACEGKLKKEMVFRLADKPNSKSVQYLYVRVPGDKYHDERKRSQSRLQPISDEQSNIYWSFAQVVPEILAESKTDDVLLLAHFHDDRSVSIHFGSRKADRFQSGGVIYSVDGRREGFN